MWIGEDCLDIIFSFSCTTEQIKIKHLNVDLYNKFKITRLCNIGFDINLYKKFPDVKELAIFDNFFIPPVEDLRNLKKVILINQGISFSLLIFGDKFEWKVSVPSITFGSSYPKRMPLKQGVINVLKSDYILLLKYFYM